MPLPHLRYLHGFGSGPKTEKGIELGKRLAGSCASYGIPDLEAGDFRGLTMQRMSQRVLATCPSDGPVVLIGSSLGGYLASLIAAARDLPNLAGLVLIAPAFAFTQRWQQTIGTEGIAAWRSTGERLFFHHGEQRELPLGSAFLDSCRALPDLPDNPCVPCAVIHGRDDETVDHRHSVSWAQRHPVVELHLVQGDHRLNTPRHAELIAWAVHDVCSRIQD
ncbi:MAG: YqiA/YcfP family alpha/beta fold hydrolase [Planctomycetota bacterium]